MQKEELTHEHTYLAHVAKALAHPVRIAILNLLAKQECCYHGDLSEIIPVAKSTLSQHLKELKNAGLIKGEITLPNIKYCIDQKNWATAKKFFATFFDDIVQNSDMC